MTYKKIYLFFIPIVLLLSGTAAAIYVWFLALIDMLD